MGRAMDVVQLLRELIQIGIDLTSERDLSLLLERILREARRFTRAEAGTLFLREGDQLRFAVVQNDPMARKLGEREMQRLFEAEPLPMSETSLAGYVALTGEVLNLPDCYAIPPDVPYTFNRDFDVKTGYQAHSMIVVPLKDPAGNVLGVLELINALDETNTPVPFDPEYADLVRALASQAAVAIRNAQLEDLSFKDGLTGVYNRRHFMLRMEEEIRRHARFRQPVSLVLIDLDHFKEINDQFGHGAGDEALKGVSQLLLRSSRSFTVITRYGGDEFAVLLVDTPKAGAAAYAERIRVVVEGHSFPHGALTLSLGVAGLPEDGASGADLISAADKALYEAKRLGRNRVGVL
ncbi:MAG: sensor domain-containing diguanylate cyclase [Candidatus Rokubacteria bacterium]|nr:sensor domain-containing diguanylate cyclase [Candidatus Rokubacteria bacterium]